MARRISIGIIVYGLALVLIGKPLLRSYFELSRDQVFIVLLANVVLIAGVGIWALRRYAHVVADDA